MEEAHPEGESPFVAPEDKCGSGSSSRLGSPGTRAGHDGRGNGKARVIHLKPKKTNATPKTRPAAAAAASAVVTTESPHNSDSTSDDDDEVDEGGEAAEEDQFEDCPVDGCHESLLASEMAFHIDLHAALDYQDRPPGDTDSSKSVNSVQLSGAAETRKTASTLVRSSPTRHGRDGSRERHRERREHQRSRKRGKDRPHASELGLSTPRRQSSSHQTFLSRKPSTAIRSWLAIFAGAGPRKYPPLEEREQEKDKEKEKEKTTVSSVQKAGHTPSSKGSSPKATAAESEGPKRLGKAELGKYADEERMPDTLAIYLKKEWGVRHQGENVFPAM